MEQYQLKDNDRNSNYFHFTKKINLENIEAQGIIPKIGPHAKHLEKTPKVFFVNGIDNLLILFDCWINVWIKLPRISLVYMLGSKAIHYKWFPKIIADGYFKYVKNSKSYINRGYKVFDKILEDCILLNLDLKEGIDFISTDNDEIKMKGYHKEHLITMGYSQLYSDLEGTTMDPWNMHTLSNHGINPDKIKLCYIGTSFKLKDIFLYALDNTDLDLKVMCPILYQYIKSRNIL